MKSIVNSLEARVIDTNKLLLDSNNPRYCAFRRRVAVHKIAEPAVQEKALQDISEEDVDKIKDSVLQVGFLPIDKIVVVSLQKDSDYFVVIEGNRRLAAVKTILQEIQGGLEVPEEITKTLNALNVLVLKGEFYNDSSETQLLIQGLRHISGIKSWQPYQQAKALVAITNGGRSITDAAKAIGVGRSNASWLKKAFLAFEDMRKNEEVELPKDEAKAISYFSYFVELLKDVNLRQYFGWSEEKNVFENAPEILKFYHWIGVHDNEEGTERQIPGALNVRNLYEVLTHPDARRVFEAGNTIDTAYSLCAPPPQQKEDDYSGTLKEILSKLDGLPSTFVKHMSKDDKELLQRVISIASEHLGQ